MGHLNDAWSTRVAMGDGPSVAAERAMAELGPPGRVALRFFLLRLATDLRAAATVPRWLAYALTLDVIGSLVVVLVNAPVDWLAAAGRAPFLGTVFGAGTAVYLGVAVAVRFAVRSLKRAAGDRELKGRAFPFEVLAVLGLLGIALAVWYGLLPSLATSLVRRAMEPHYLRTTTTLWVILASCGCVLVGYGAAVAQVRLRV